MRAGVASSLATTTSTYRYILYIQKIKFIIILDQHKYRYRVYWSLDTRDKKGLKMIENDVIFMDGRKNSIFINSTI